jgi:hypothetical protein
MYGSALPCRALLAGQRASRRRRLPVSPVNEVGGAWTRSPDRSPWKTGTTRRTPSTSVASTPSTGARAPVPLRLGFHHADAACQRGQLERRVGPNGFRDFQGDASRPIPGHSVSGCTSRPSTSTWRSTRRRIRNTEFLFDNAPLPARSSTSSKSVAPQSLLHPRSASDPEQYEGAVMLDNSPQEAGAMAGAADRAVLPAGLAGCGSGRGAAGGEPDPRTVVVKYRRPAPACRGPAQAMGGMEAVSMRTTRSTCSTPGDTWSDT